MPVTVACPYCSGEVYQAPDLMGRLVTCPHCSGQFKMPENIVAEPFNPYRVDTSSGSELRIRKPSRLGASSVACSFLCWIAFWGIWGLEDAKRGGAFAVILVVLILSVLGFSIAAFLSGVFAMFREDDNAALGFIGALMASPVIIGLGMGAVRIFAERL